MTAPRARTSVHRGSGGARKVVESVEKPLTAPTFRTVAGAAGTPRPGMPWMQAARMPEPSPTLTPSSSPAARARLVAGLVVFGVPVGHAVMEAIASGYRLTDVISSDSDMR